jgi:hypothetical protein
MASTTHKKRRTPAQLAADGFAALVEKLGVADAIRFLHVHDPGQGDYTRERSQWLDRLNADDVRRLMAKTPKKRTPKR